MMAMTPRSSPHSISASSAPMPAEGKRRQDRDRMDEALIEHAQHDIDRDDRRQDEQQISLPSEAWKASAAPWKTVTMLARHADLLLGLADGVDRLAERDAGRQIEGDGRRGELAEMVDLQRRRLRLEVVAMALKRHLPAAGRDGR